MIGIDTSDLGRAIGQLERFEQNATIAAARAMNPKRWVGRARKRANQVMMLMAENGEEHLIVPKLAGLVTAAFWDQGGGHGMAWSLAAPTEGLDVRQTVMHEATGGLFRESNIKDLNRLKNFVFEWVKTEKDKDERDAGKSDEQIARGIVNILVGKSSELRAAARKKLLPHIQDFINRNTKELLSAEKLEKWLNAVLDAWVDLALEEVPEEIDEELLAEWDKAMGSMV